MADATVADQAAGLVLFGFESTTAKDLPADLLARSAGAILFRRNIKNAGQLRALTDAIRSLRPADGTAPIIALDQEGGPVSRLAGIGTTTPAAMALGAAADPSLTKTTYRLVGDELAALGVNVDLAPVADLNDDPANPVIGTRSFGDAPIAVSAHVRAAIAGLHAAGIAATAKHFPGHGDTRVDSHLDLPVISRTLTQLRMGELIPFAGAIAEGVDLIMTAHILFPAVEAEALPATLSSKILSGLLREDLGFGGVIVTDCMEMRAIADRFTPGEAAIRAVAAGADLVLFSHTVELARAARDALAVAIADGTLPEQRVRESLDRITALRRRLAAADNRRRASRLEEVGGEAHQAAALQAARRSITVVRDPKGRLPLQPSGGDKILVVQFTGAAASSVEDGQTEASGAREPHAQAPTPAPARVRYGTAIGRALACSPARVQEQVRSLDPAGHEYKQLLMAAGSANMVVAVTSRATQHAMQARAVADLELIGKRVIAVAAREPYDALVLPENTTVLASFGEDPHAMQAAAEVILGEEVARGNLPIRLASQAGELR